MYAITQLHAKTVKAIQTLAAAENLVNTALSANLIAENKFDLLVGESNKCHNNRILFRFDGKFDITVISCPKYCEFRFEALRQRRVLE